LHEFHEANTNKAAFCELLVLKHKSADLVELFFEVIKCINLCLFWDLNLALGTKLLVFLP